MTRDECVVQMIEELCFASRSRWMEDGNPYWFDGCTLKRQIGLHEIGTNVASISIDVEKHEMQLFLTKTSQPETFRLAVKLEIFDV